MRADMLRHWLLDPGVTFLNHGSFGACPVAVLGVQSEWRARMERRPIEFLDVELEGHLDRARAALAEFIGAESDDLAFVPNATTGVNTILRSLDLVAGDEVLTTDHEYNACLNAIRFATDRVRARTVVANVPLPLDSAEQVTDAILAAATARTRLAVISHVTSPTGLVFPIADIVARLAERGIDTLVDGAHAPGMVALDLSALGAAYYTGNAHKWLCAPKGSAFLHVRRDRQPSIRPLAVSHGANSPRLERSRFRLEFDWGGTGDPTPFLSITSALAFMAGLMAGGWSELRAANRELVVSARRLLLATLPATVPLAPEDMLGSLAAVVIPDTLSPEPEEPDRGAQPIATHPLDPLRDALFSDDRIEVPVHYWPHTAADSAPRQRLLRISAQAYNEPADYERLAAALSARM